jgi:LacI family transcriptional regulator
MQDVAEAAGVSLGTVSHVLSGSHPVNPETRERVDVAIRQLAFRPNRVARALAGDRSSTIGVLLPDIANPFFAELARGAEDVLGRADFAVLFGNSDNDAGKERRYLSNFSERRVDGMIALTTAGADAEELRQLTAYIPVVVVDRVAPGWGGDTVVGDNETGMMLAVRHLAQLGHRRIALINGDPGLSTAIERRAGFVRAASDEGLEVRLLSEGEFTFESGFDQARALLALPEPPTGVCAANDLLALAVLGAAADLGRRVPRDLSVVGYDDIVFAKVASPALTTIHQPAYDMGAAAAKLLLKRLRDSTRRASRRVVMKPALVVRASTAPVRVR